MVEPASYRETRTRIADYLDDVSCTSASNCIAVGETPGESAIAEHWDGTQWSRTSEFPVPYEAAKSVSCTSSSSCIATLAGGGAGAASYDGSSWTSTPPADVNDSFAGVACASATSCTAVGKHATGGAFDIAIGEHWNGAQWSSLATLQPIADTPSALSSVRCTSASNCVAVGAQNTTIGSAPLAERWNGSAWSLQAIAAPPNVANALLDSVSCANASRCAAVGQQGDSYQYDMHSLAELWNGTTWSLQSVPQPGFLSQLSAVACPSTSRCFAVGSTATAAYAPITLLIDQWNGTRWSRMSVPSTGRYYASLLQDITCVSATDCTAVGGAANAEYQTLIEHWDGSTWTVRSSPPAPSESPLQLNGVTCTSSVNCVAVGFAADERTGAYLPRFERWNGKAWSMQAAPSGVTTWSPLASVGCLSASDCTAVGAGSATASIAHWDGAHWAFRAAPVPTGLSETALSGVSCAGGHCIAVGTAADGTITDDQPVTYIVRSS